MLKFFKGKDKGNLIYAPCKGRVVPLAEVPDPVFADKVLGDGFAVILCIPEPSADPYRITSRTEQCILV